MIAAALLLAAAAGAAPPNVLLVTIDTLRADRVGCYGYAAAETPVLDELAKGGVLLEDATVQVPQTRPSHASLLTGRWPFEHGIRDNYSPPLARTVPTLATQLKAAGYRTAAFVASFVLSRASGLGRGFDRYGDPFSGARRGSALYERPERRGSEVVDDALAWLGKPGAAPFFAWVHLYDPHAPYNAPAPFGARFAKAPYDGEVAYADQQVGRLIAWLDAKKLRGKTLVVVTSDHGEGLGDHGEDEHMLLVYDSTLRVPLIASWPGTLGAGRRIAGQFRSVDLLPTVLELAGAAPLRTSGTSRAANLRGGTRIPDNESYAESLYGSIHFGYAPLRALRSESWKYIEAPRPELYNVRDDPAEQKDMTAVRGQVASRLEERLRTYDSARTATAAAAKIAPDAGTLERLAALGYVGGSAPRGGRPTGADPKDKIGEVQGYIRDFDAARRLTNAGKWDEAAPILERLGRGEIMGYEVEMLRGRAFLRGQRFTEAAASLEQAITLVPRGAEAYVLLASAYAGAGRSQDAVGALERGAVVDPKNVRLRLALSALYRDQGEVPKAVAELRTAVAADPKSADAWNALGSLLAQGGAGREAVAAFRSGLAAKADDPDMLFGLAALLGGAEAAQLLERLVATTPDYPGAAQALAAVRRAQAPLGPGEARLRLWRANDSATLEAVRATLVSGKAPDDPGRVLGTVRTDDLEEPLRTAAAALRPGMTSAVLTTATGFALLFRER